MGEVNTACLGRNYSTQSFLPRMVRAVADSYPQFALWQDVRSRLSWPLIDRLYHPKDFLRAMVGHYSWRCCYWSEIM